MIGQHLIQALVGPGASSGLTHKSFKLSLIPVLGGYPVCGPFWLVKTKPKPESKSGWMMDGCTPHPPVWWDLGHHHPGGLTPLLYET
jgi:hypothetical protein